MRHEHAVIGEEFASLDNIVAASAEESGAHDADYLGQKVIVLLQGVRVLGVALELWVGGEEAARVHGAEEVGVEDVFGTRAGLGYLEEEGQTGVLVVALMLIGGVWSREEKNFSYMGKDGCGGGMQKYVYVEKKWE